MGRIPHRVSAPVIRRQAADRELPISSPSANPVGRLEGPMPEEGLLSQLKQLSSASPSRRTWPITSGSPASPASPCSRRTRCRRSPMRPKKSCACSSSSARRRSASPGRSRPSSRRFSPSWCSRTARPSTRIPSGGGAYIVAKDNLGETPALIAAAALLIDYVLTVAVSIAAGVAAITSAFPEWHVESRASWRSASSSS